MFLLKLTFVMLCSCSGAGGLAVMALTVISNRQAMRSLEDRRNNMRSSLDAGEAINTDRRGRRGSQKRLWKLF